MAAMKMLKAQCCWERRMFFFQACLNRSISTSLMFKLSHMVEFPKASLHTHTHTSTHTETDPQIKRSDFGQFDGA